MVRVCSRVLDFIRTSSSEIKVCLVLDLISIVAIPCLRKTSKQAESQKKHQLKFRTVREEIAERYRNDNNKNTPKNVNTEQRKIRRLSKQAKNNESARPRHRKLSKMPQTNAKVFVRKEATPDRKHIHSTTSFQNGAWLSAMKCCSGQASQEDPELIVCQKLMKGKKILRVCWESVLLQRTAESVLL